eukprot:7449944-Alexandrium_andersonii.AAC.1
MLETHTHTPQHTASTVPTTQRRATLPPGQRRPNEPSLRRCHTRTVWQRCQTCTVETHRYAQTLPGGVWRCPLRLPIAQT